MISNNSIICYAIAYCLFSNAFVLGAENPVSEQFKIIEFLTGSWKCRTTDLNGKLLYDPSVVSFESSFDGTVCCEKIVGQTNLVTVYRMDSADTIVRIDIRSRPLPVGATTTVLIGGFDKITRTISWSDKNKKVDHTWRIINKDTIVVELPPDPKVKVRNQLMLWTRIAPQK